MNPNDHAPSVQPKISLLATMLVAGMAGGMAWGIRGQYGHESGAAIAGVLVGFALVSQIQGQVSSLRCARAVAMLALGISIGGSMTYGQTVGLTQDAPLVGNNAAYFWGMLGLAIKGGVWIGLGATFFGMGLSGNDYRPLELCILFGVMMGSLLLGVYLFNTPFDVEDRLLPKLYFSDHWYWEPDVDRPRREQWGGLVFALAVLLIYLKTVRQDRVGWSLGVFGLLAGAVGFPAGQTVQAFSAWHREWIANLPTSGFTVHFNWWNMMETTFGCVFGAIVGIGFWMNHKHIVREIQDANTIRIPPVAEFSLAFLHIPILLAWNFLSIAIVDWFGASALPMIVLPVICVMSGKFWPYLVALPIVMIPIAGKTVRELVFRAPPELATSPELGWPLYVFAPLLATTALAMFFATRSDREWISRYFPSVSLFAVVWIYYGLNHAFFFLPWPWKDWTARTANDIIFFLCAVGLSAAAMLRCTSQARST